MKTNKLGKVSVRSAVRADVPLILDFIKQLAEYEKLSDAVVATVEELETQLFGNKPVADVLLGYDDDQPVGFALFFANFSTFRAKPGVYLEDLFVIPAARGKGVGKALLNQVIEIARERQCGRVEWSVLDWNKPAIAFYESIGARPLDDWTLFRLSL